MSNEGGLESTIEEFVKLEGELGGSATASNRTYNRGVIAGATKVPAGEVPDEYPFTVGRGDVLRIAVDVDDGNTVSTYMEWPDVAEEEGHVRSLLDALGRSQEEFASVFGDRVALAAEDGWHRIDFGGTTAMHGAEQAQTDPAIDRSEKFLAAAIGVGALGFLLSGTVLDSFSFLLSLLAWAVIPSAVYFDLQKLKEMLNWETSTLPWIAGCLVPVFNVSVAIAYFIDRHVRLSGVTPGQVSDTWFKAIIVGVLMPWVGVFLTLVNENLGTMVFGYSLVLLPLAIYFDAEYVEDATDWDPNEEWWAIATFLLMPVAFVVALAYLYKRSQATS